MDRCGLCLLQAFRTHHSNTATLASRGLPVKARRAFRRLEGTASSFGILLHSSQVCFARQSREVSRNAAIPVVSVRTRVFTAVQCFGCCQPADERPAWNPARSPASEGHAPGAGRRWAHGAGSGVEAAALRGAPWVVACGPCGGGWVSGGTEAARRDVRGPDRGAHLPRSGIWAWG